MMDLKMDNFMSHDNSFQATFPVDLIFFLYTFQTSASTLHQKLIKLKVNYIEKAEGREEVWAGGLKGTHEHLGSTSHASAHTKSDKDAPDSASAA